jgi:YD repeat-containing protein
MLSLSLLALTQALAASGSVNYTYDELGRLVQATYGDDSATRYAMDPSGNRKSFTTLPDVVAPTTPTNLSGVATSATNINLSWTAATDVVGVTGYKIFRNGSTAPIGTSATTAYSDSTVVGSTTYIYAVAAYDVAGNISANSSTVSVTTFDSTPPSQPTGLTVTAFSYNNVSMSWQPSTDNIGVTGYNVYRNGVTTPIGTSASTTYSDTSVAASTLYTYTVAAFDARNNVSAQSTSVNATTTAYPPPTVPTGLSASAPTSNAVNLSWTASSDGAGPGIGGYKIYRNGGVTPIATTTGIGTTYSDTTVAGSIAYTYAVACYDAVGSTSAQSTTVSITTPDTIPPTQPTGLTASAASGSQINLSWTASTDSGGAGLAGYKVFRNGSQAGTSATTAYSDTGLSPLTAYTYTVQAYDNATPSANVSPQSTASSATTLDGYIQITDTAGSALASASALYGTTTSCSGGFPLTSCTWVLAKKYGNLASVWSTLGINAPGCPLGITTASTTGYQRPSTSNCQINALASVYGH